MTLLYFLLLFKKVINFLIISHFFLFSKNRYVLVKLNELRLSPHTQELFGEVHVINL